MEDFIFSLNATMPVFIVIFAGWFLKQIKVLGKDFVSVNNKLVFNILFPILLFRDISQMDLRKDFSVKFVVFCFLASLIGMIVIWFLARLFIKEKPIVGSFVQGSFRGSAAILGVAFAENVYGSAGMVPLMIIAAVPLYNVFSVILLTMCSRERVEGKGWVKSALKQIITNPMIIGIFLGIPFALLNAELPVMLAKPIDSLCALTTPLALLLVGAGFDAADSLKKIKPTVIASIIKLVILPGIVVPVAVAIGFRGSELLAILIMSGSPATVSGYIMAKNMKNDETVASGVVVLTTLFSAVSITLFIYALRSLSYM